MNGIAIAVALALAHAALGPDALQVIDRVLRHAAPPPPGSPALARELLAQPLRALDAEAIFRRSVPGTLARFAVESAAEVAAQPFEDVLERYVGEVEAAREALLAATSGAEFEARLLERLPQGLPSSGQLAAVAPAVDPAALERANLRFSRRPRASCGSCARPACGSRRRAAPPRASAPSPSAAPATSGTPRMPR